MKDVVFKPVKKYFFNFLNEPLTLNYRQVTDNLHNDTALWTAFKQGDKQAYVQIYQKYVRLLLVYGVKIWKNEAAVQDTVQDLFIELWKNRDRLSVTNNIKIYLFQALRYKLLRQKSKTDSDYVQLIHDDILKESSYESFLIEAEHTAEQIQKLNYAIRELPPRQQEALHLRFYQDCSHEEIAQIMDIQYQSVSNLIHKALDALKQHFKETWLLLGFAAFF